MIKSTGVRKKVYTGLQPDRFHIHAEMVDALQGILDAVGKIEPANYPVWTKVSWYIEAYLGDTPETFTHEGKGIPGSQHP